MKRILTFAPLLAFCLLPCYAGVVTTDTLTVTTPTGAEWVSVDSNGNITGNDYGILGGSGSGCPVDQAYCLISGSLDPYALYYINDSTLPDPAQGGATPTVTMLIDPDLITFSDEFGIYGIGQDANGNPIYALGFYGSAPGIPSPLQGAGATNTYTEPAGPATWNATSLIDPALQCPGGGGEGECEVEGPRLYTANFADDYSASVPEPATVFLLGIGLAAFVLRKRVHA